MNDGPGLSAWDLARERCEPLDAAYRERIARELALEASPEHIMALEREYQPYTRRAHYDVNGPHWPAWAKHPAHCPPGRCAACHGTINGSGKGPRNQTGICGACGHRAHKQRQRMAWALRMFRAGEWKP